MLETFESHDSNGLNNNLHFCSKKFKRQQYQMFANGDHLDDLMRQATSAKVPMIRLESFIFISSERSAGGLLLQSLFLYGKLVINLSKASQENHCSLTKFSNIKSNHSLAQPSKRPFKYYLSRFFLLFLTQPPSM